MFLHIVWIFSAAAAAYQILATLAAFARLRPAKTPPAMLVTPVSILKPVRGAEPGFAQAVDSNAAQDYIEFEILFGSRDAVDPGLEIARSIAPRYPAGRIRTLRTYRVAPNRKVGVLIDLEREARGEILIVSDADIRVPSGYLREVVAPLADPSVGLVTCLYRARSTAWPARFEALGIATDFAPSAMVAPFVGVDEFGLGATLAFRRSDLRRIGGFEAIAPYLADDYQLGRKIHQLGLHCVLSNVVVETSLGTGTWSGIWRHQVRWARTIRLSRTGAYFGMPLSNGTLWAAVAALAGQWWIAGALLALRLVMAVIAGWMVLRSSDALRLIWLVPVRDLFAAAVWCAGLGGDSVEWGEETLRLARDGKIIT